MPARKRPDNDPPPGPPSEDVERKQDPEHTTRDFLRDLAKVTRRDPESPPPDQGNSKTSDAD